MAVLDVAPVAATVADLVEEARHGDAQAWDALYRRLYPRLYAYAGRHAGWQHAGDVVGETMARAVTGIGRFRRGSTFDAWVFGICRRVISEQLRAAARQSPLPVPEVAAPDPAPDAAVLADEERAALREAFSNLDEDERELLELRVVGGLTATEVAAVLHKRPGAVRMAQSRALHRLRHLWAEVDPEREVSR